MKNTKQSMQSEKETRKAGEKRGSRDRKKEEEKNEKNRLREVRALGGNRRRGERENEVRCIDEIVKLVRNKKTKD
jgi:hypothetical protein